MRIYRLEIKKKKFLTFDIYIVVSLDRKCQKSFLLFLSLFSQKKLFLLVHSLLLQNIGAGGMVRTDAQIFLSKVAMINSSPTLPNHTQGWFIAKNIY